MPRNSNGVYAPPVSNWNPAVNGTPMSADAWNSLLTDMSNALTQSVSRDGQSPMSGMLNMNGYAIRNLGAPTGNGHALRRSQIVKGPTLTSASNLAIPNEGNLFDVSGTTTILTLENDIVGRRALLRFEDELTLEPSTQMLLPGGNEVLTEEGMILEFVQVEPGIWSLLTGPGGGGGSGSRMIITSTQNIVLPASRIWVTACGPGGNGAPGAGGSSGRSGGGGALFIRREFAVTRGATVTATIGAPGAAGSYGSPTTLTGIFSLAAGQSAPVGTSGGNTGGQGGAVSMQGEGGISSAGAQGGPRSPSGSGYGGGGGGSLGGGGGGAPSGGQGGIPGMVKYGDNPDPGSNSNASGGDGIGVGYASTGGMPDGAIGGRGSYGAGGGGSGASNTVSSGPAGAGLIIIETA